MTEENPVRIGVDIGGTFTDFQIFDARTGQIRPFKVPTTPEDPSIGLMEGIKGAAARDGFDLADVGYILHGTTIATNAAFRASAEGAMIGMRHIAAAMSSEFRKLDRDPSGLGR